MALKVLCPCVWTCDRCGKEEKSTIIVLPEPILDKLLMSFSTERVVPPAWIVQGLMIFCPRCANGS